MKQLGLELFPLMYDLRDMTMGPVPGLGGVLSGLSVSGTGRITSGSSCPPWDIYSVSDCSGDDGGVCYQGFRLIGLVARERLRPWAKLLDWMVGCADSRIDQGNESLRWRRPRTHGCENVRSQDRCLSASIRAISNHPSTSIVLYPTIRL